MTDSLKAYHSALARQLRAEFPILETDVGGLPLCYLDNAATTQKPRRVIDSLTDYYLHYNANVHRAAHTLSGIATQRFETVRRKVAQWLHSSDACEIVWTRGTTEAINLVANSFVRPRLNSDSIILVQADAHHANIVPWQLIAQETGAQIQVIPVHDGVIDIRTFQRLLETRPAFIALSHVSNALGSLHPVAELCALAQNANVPVLVDGAQAAPHLNIDVQALGCDFYAFSGHKLFGPTGIGVLWGKRHWLESMPPWQGGGEMIESVSFEETRFAGLPFRFEAGTPNIEGVIGLGSAIDFLNSYDNADLHALETAVCDYAIECCQTVPGFQLIPRGEQAVSLFSFQLQGHHQQDVALWLDREGIAVRAGHHCAMPLMQSLGLPGTLRASFAFYNTNTEAERLAQSLDRLYQAERTQISTDLLTGEASYKNRTLDPANVSKPSITIPDTLFTAVKSAKTWQLRYRALMKLGGFSAPVSTDLRQSENRVQGCESDVWLKLDLDPSGRLACDADSDARILRALLYLLLREVNGYTPLEVHQKDLNATFEKLDLRRHLSPTKGNGLTAMITAVQRYVAALLP